jgi:hypothetical protein
MMSKYHNRPLAVAMLAAFTSFAVIRSLYAYPVGHEFRVNTNVDDPATPFDNDQVRSDVAMDANGNFVVVFQNEDPALTATVAARLYNSTGVPQADQFRVNTTGGNDNTFPKVAMDGDGDFVVVWVDNAADSSSDGIMLQRYNAVGVEQGVNVTVNSTTQNQQHRPDVATDADGDFVVVWEDNQFSQVKRRIRGQRFSSDGAPQGGEFEISTDTAIDHAWPRVAMDANGDFVVCWESGNVGADTDLAVRRFDATGNALGAAFLVNGTTRVSNASGVHSQTSVAMDADGNFVVVWRADDATNAAIGIVGQRLDAAGVPVGAMFEVDTRSPALTNKPEVAMNADGDFIVSYEADDGSLVGAWARGYDSDGVPKGTPIRVNTFTSFIQKLPAVGIDTNANAVVVWESNGNAEQDGAGSGIFGQRLSSGLGPPHADIVVDFGGPGLWARMNDASWLKLNNTSPDMVVVGDVDGNDRDDVVAYFSSFGGIFVKRNLGGWSQFSTLAPEAMAVGDLDDNGKDDVVIDFGGIGLWARMNDVNWLKLNNTSPDQVVVGDMDGNDMDDVIAYFSSFGGIFVKRNLGGWSQFSTLIPEAMAVGDLDGNGKDDVVIDFGGIGLWARMNDASWRKLHNGSPELIATGDVDGNGADDVLATFPGLGFWQKLNLGGWTGDGNASGKDDIIADFGSTLGGIFVKRDQGAWVKLHNSSPDSLATGNLDTQ